MVAARILKKLIPKRKRKRKSPTQRIFNKGEAPLSEGARVDSVTLGSPEVARKIDKGEAGKVTTGAGTRAQSFTKEQETPITRKPAQEIVNLEIKKREVGLTDKEQNRLDFLNRRNVEAELSRRENIRKGKGQGTRTGMLDKTAYQRKLIKKRDKDPLIWALETGEIPEGFTENQVRLILQNAAARKLSPKQRERLALAVDNYSKNKLKAGKPKATGKTMREDYRSGGMKTKFGHTDYRKGGLFK